GAGDQGLGGRAAGIDAGAAEILALDQRHRHPGLTQPLGQRRAGLAGADDDGVGRAGHRLCTIRKAPTMAMASSISAAGMSLPNAVAMRPRSSAPPKVPITAPTIPATSPPISDPPAVPITAPLKPPDTNRAPNCTGTLRLGVCGSWSVTSSTAASTVQIKGV